jgi:hypothetical protein
MNMNTPETDADTPWHSNRETQDEWFDRQREKYAILEQERDATLAKLTHVHRWVERNHPDGFIDSQSHLQNLERVTEHIHDKMDKLKCDFDYALSLLASEKSMRNGIIKKSAELEIKCVKIGEVITELNQRLQERQESFQAQLIRIEEIWRGKLVESRKDADRLYNCLLEAQFGEALDIAYVQNVLAQHEELAAIG